MHARWCPASGRLQSDGHDLGISNHAMRTENIDGLIRGGVALSRFYAQKECAPSRSSMMTGRLPFTYGYYENPSDDGGIPTNYTLLPAVLKARSYRTHAIGKWHCGFRTPAHVPTSRGFDSFMGFWHWGEEYLDHMFPPYYKDAKCRGVDFVNSTGKGVAAVTSMNGTLSTQVYLAEFERIVRAHPGSAPLYVYLAFQNAHDPYEHAPPELVDHYPTGGSELRRNFSAIVEDLDLAVGRVVALLKDTGLWGDTVIWFNSDNGAELPFQDQSRCSAACLTTGCCGGAGNNYPLRGGKFTLFEGGIRARAFVYSASTRWIPTSRRGTTWSGLAHVSDIFATFAGRAGAQVKVGASSDSFGDVVDSVETDGFDLWEAIVGGGASPRKELLHQPINTYWNVSCKASDVRNPFTPSCGASITMLPFKLYVGFPGDGRVVEWPPAVQPRSERSGGAASAMPSRLTAQQTRDLCVERPCLFNIEEDLSEAHDLALEKPDVVERLHSRLHSLSAPKAQPQPADALTPVPSDAACAMVESTGAWLPWDSDAKTGDTLERAGRPSEIFT